MSVPPSNTSDTAVSLGAALRAGGVWIDYGACVVRLRSPMAALADQLGLLYHAFPLAHERAFADYHVSVDFGRGLRRYLRPTCRFAIDGVEPFEPFPAANALPMFEWGVNWCFAQRGNQFVLLHAGVLARDGKAVVMAATPGAGKSTLTAAMMLRGFRLLSDEFGVLDPANGKLHAMLKPVALKNRSIDIIRAFSADAVIGPVFRGTRKGDVAHLAPDAASAEAAGQGVRPALVIFPRFAEGGRLEVKPQPPEQAFSRLAFNSFNYALLGPVSFDAVTEVAAACPAYELRYGKLEQAIDCIGELLADARGETDAT